MRRSLSIFTANLSKHDQTFLAKFSNGTALLTDLIPVLLTSGMKTPRQKTKIDTVKCIADVVWSLLMFILGITVEF